MNDFSLSSPSPIEAYALRHWRWRQVVQLMASGVYLLIKEIPFMVNALAMIAMGYIFFGL